MILVFRVQLIFSMSNSLDKEIAGIIGSLSKCRALVITVGNPFRFDDGVGPYIAAQLEGLKLTAKVLNAFDKPENIINQAIDFKPEKTLIIDSVIK